MGKPILWMLAIFACFVGLIFIDDFENTEPVAAPIIEEIPWAIFLEHCGDLVGLIITTSPPQWYLHGEDINTDSWPDIIAAKQMQFFNLAGTMCTLMEPDNARKIHSR